MTRLLGARLQRARHSVKPRRAAASVKQESVQVHCLRARAAQGFVEAQQLGAHARAQHRGVDSVVKCARRQDTPRAAAA